MRNTNIPFSNEEVEIIQSNFGKITMMDIWRKIQRPGLEWFHVRNKAICMGLTRKILNHSIPNKNMYDTNYWDKPTLMNSFLAGEIAGDGCLFINRHKSPVFAYKCLTKDESILDVFIKELKYTGPKTYTSSKCSLSKSGNISHLCQIVISSGFEKNVADLNKWFNIPCQRKTLRLGPTNLDDKNLNFAYLLGLLDSDGSVESSGASIKYPRLQISFNSGSLPLVEWVQKLVEDEFSKYAIYDRGGYKIRRLKDSNCFQVYFGGIKAIKLFEYLRSFPLPKLARKWENPKALEVVEFYKKKYPDLFVNSPIFQENISQNNSLIPSPSPIITKQ